MLSSTDGTFHGHKHSVPFLTFTPQHYHATGKQTSMLQKNHRSLDIFPLSAAFFRAFWPSDTYPVDLKTGFFDKPLSSILLDSKLTEASSDGPERICRRALHQPGFIDRGGGDEDMLANRCDEGHSHNAVSGVSGSRRTGWEPRCCH